MKSKILLTIILLFLFISPVQATPCDSEDIARLKNLAEHVDISYSKMDPYTSTEKDTTITHNYKYEIKLSNMTEEMYAVSTDKYNNKILLKYDSNKKNGEINLKYLDPGKQTITIYSTNCKNTLKQDTVYLLYYNEYYNDVRCNRIPDRIKVCEEWTKELVTEEILENGLNSYTKYYEDNKPKQRIIDFIEDNMNLILLTIGVLIITCIVIIIIKKKNSELK